MWSVPSRRSEFSTSRMIHRREPPRELASSPIGMKNLVARTTSSRRPWSASPPDLLGHAAGVDVGGVDEVDPGVQRTVDDADGVGAVVVAPGAEHHRTEAHRADLDAGAAERSVLHEEPSSCQAANVCLAAVMADI